MKEVVVYTEKDYSKNISIYVPIYWDKDAIRKRVDKEFGEWYYFDIIENE